MVGARIHPDDRRLIDQAALELGQKRGHFLVEAAVEKARRVLGRAPAIEEPLRAAG